MYLLKLNKYARFYRESHPFIPCEFWFKSAGDATKFNTFEEAKKVADTFNKLNDGAVVIIECDY